MSVDQSSRRNLIFKVVAASIFFTLILVFVLKFFVAEPYRLSSESMEPTLLSGEVILALKNTPKVQRGDVVVFDSKGYFSSLNTTQRYWVKRVIAVGGDTVKCCSEAGFLEVNGQALAESYLPYKIDPQHPASAEEFYVQVPAGRVFLLGDNRLNSTDSRNFLGAPGGGMLPEEKIVGHVGWIIWPVSEFREVS